MERCADRTNEHRSYREIKMFKVLIVDDDQRKASAIATALRDECSCDVNNITHVSDVLQAKRLLASDYYSLLLLDVALPMRVDEGVRLEGGLELLKEICERPNYRMPGHIVGLSGNKDALDQVRAEFNKRVIGLIEYDPSSDAWRGELVTCVLRIMAAELASRQTGASYGIDCAVVCALDDPELDAVRRLNWPWNSDSDESDSTRYWRATVINDKGAARTVVATSAARMGMVAAALISAKLIARYRPRFIVMVGITAGVLGKTQLGDVIVGDPVWDYGSGKWISKREGNQFLPAPHQIALDAGVRRQFVELSEDSAWLTHVRASWPGDKPPTVLSIKVGPAASGAAVLADGDSIARVREQHREMLGVDMEAYAMYAAAASAPAPRPISVSMKAVVDFATPEKGDQVQRYAAYVSAQVLRRFVVTVI